jgi:hypothetical protein
MTERTITRLDRWRIISSGVLACLVALVGLAAQSVAYVHLAQRTDLSTLGKWHLAIYDSEFTPLLLIVPFVIWRGEASRGVRTWALSLAFTGLNGALIALYSDHPPFLSVTLREAAVISFWLALGLVLRASQDFPDPLRAADLARDSKAWRSLPWLRVLLRALLHPLAVWALILSLVLASHVLPRWFDAAIKISVVALGAAYWRAHWQVGNELQRRKVGWLLQSGLTYLALYFLGLAVFGAIGPGPSTFHTIVSLIFNLLSMILINLCIVLAIFRAGAVNPALVVRRTFVYGVTAAMLTFGLEVGAHLVAETLKETLAISDRLQGAVLGTFAGLAFRPVTHRLHLLFDHLSQAHAHKHDAAHALGGHIADAARDGGAA